MEEKEEEKNPTSNYCIFKISNLEEKNQNNTKIYNEEWLENRLIFSVNTTVSFLLYHPVT